MTNRFYCYMHLCHYQTYYTLNFYVYKVISLIQFWKDIDMFEMLYSNRDLMLLNMKSLFILSRHLQ